METQKRSNTVGIILLSTVVIVLGVIAVLFYMNKRVNWSMTYLPDDTSPYGTKILHTLLQDISPEKTFHFIKDSAGVRLPADPTPACDNYFYIGNDFYADSADRARILEFASKGNNVYLFCGNQGHMIFDSLLRAPAYDYSEIVYDEYDYGEAEIDSSGVYIDPSEEEEEEDFNDITHYEEFNLEKRVYFVSDTVIEPTFYLENNTIIPPSISYIYDFQKMTNEWPYFRDSLRTWRGDRIETLGYFDEEYNNYIRLDYGKGSIYFHSTPIVFTNYYMRNDTAMNYCRQAFQSLGTGEFYWDEENRKYDYKAMQKNGDTTPSKPGEGPLEFILSEPSLRAAWYLMILAVLLYLIFGSRRKQRIIAVTKNMENTSIEYAEVISQMFMKQKDHKKLVMMKMELFKSFIRERFSLRLPIHMKDEDESLYKEISQKSSVPLDLVSAIFEDHKVLSSIVEVDTADMLGFHKKIEQFYITCK